MVTPWNTKLIGKCEVRKINLIWRVSVKFDSIHSHDQLIAGLLLIKIYFARAKMKVIEWDYLYYHFSDFDCCRPSEQCVAVKFTSVIKTSQSVIFLTFYLRMEELDIIRSSQWKIYDNNEQQTCCLLFIHQQDYYCFFP